MTQRTYYIMASAFTPQPRPRSRDPESRVVSWEVSYNEGMGGPDVEVGHSQSLLGAYFYCNEFHRQDQPGKPLRLKTYPEDLMETIDALLT